MEFIFLLIILFVIIFIYVKEGTLLNPIIFYLIIWLLMLFSSILGLFNLVDTSNETYSLIFISLMSSVIGYFFAKTIKLPLRKTSSRKSKIFNYNLLYAIELIIIVIFIFRFITVVNMLIDGASLSFIRSNYSELFLSNRLVALLDEYLIGPFIYLLPTISIINFFSDKRKNLLLYGTLILIILYSLTNGGRFILYYFIVQFIVMYLHTRKRTNRVKVKSFNIFILGAIIVFFVFLSQLRGIDSLFKSLYFYLSGSLPNLDYRLSVLDNLNYKSYGFAFFSGFFRIIFIFLGYLGFNFHFYDNFILTINVEDFILIAPSVHYNAFVTPLFYFYSDGGIIGVIIFSIIYGFVISTIFKMFKQRNNIFINIVYLLLIINIFTTMVRWQFIIPSYAYSYVFAFLLFKNVKE